MDIDEQLQQLNIEVLKKTLASAISQVEFLEGQLAPFIDEEILESLKVNFKSKLEKDLSGN